MFRIFIIFAVLLSISASITSTEARNLYNGVSIKAQSLPVTRLEQVSQGMDYMAINWPVYIGVQQTGAVDASFNCYGQFGLGLMGSGVDPATGWPQASFVTPPGSGTEYLFGGAIWVGGIVDQDTLVSVGADGWQITMEMWPAGMPPRPAITRFNYIADYSMRAEFYDTLTDPNYVESDPIDGRPHKPLNIRLVNRSHIWQADSANEIILYDLVITNIGSRTIENGYCGFYFDGDVANKMTQYSGYTDDLTGAIRPNGIAYIIDNDGDTLQGNFDPVYSPTKAFCYKVSECSTPIVDTNYNWWISDAESIYDFGPRHKGTPSDPFRDFGGFLGTPEGDRNKYYIMRHKEWDYDEAYIKVIDSIDTTWVSPPVSVADYFQRSDIRFLISVGPFNLSPGESYRIVYSTFTADSVHHVIGNLNNLPDHPEQYEANLHLDKIVRSGEIADSLAGLITDWNNPIIGLRSIYRNEDSVVIEWDPWVFDNVDGYELYLSPVSYDSFPYPGVVPPWLKPEFLNEYASVGVAEQFTFTGLDPDKVYFVNVANRSGGDIGDAGVPIFVKQSKPLIAPDVNNEFIFARPGDPAHVAWHPLSGFNIDHYNIYRFTDSIEAAAKYLPFYDSGYCAQFITSRDTFNAYGRNYYYYAIAPFIQIGSSDSNYADYGAKDGYLYAVSAVDNNGFESPFSKNIYFNWRQSRTKDILVVVNRISNAVDLVTYKIIKDFYDSVLAGYDYDFFNITDSMKNPVCSGQAALCLDWHDLLPYQFVIIEDGFSGQSDNVSFEKYGHAYSRYLESGGKLCIFGSLLDYMGFSNPYQFAPGFYAVNNSFLQKYFAIDSVYCIGLDYYYFNSAPPYVDSLFGFVTAESTLPGVPSLSYDTTRYPFYGMMETLWPHNTAPGVSIFRPRDDAVITHRYRSLMPEKSRLENGCAGLETDVPGTRTYLFGFRLWYMNYGDARSLIQYMLEDRATSYVCGDINNDGDLNLSDIIALINYIYKSGSEPNPYEVADINNRAGINIMDIAWLINYLYHDGPTPSCRLSNDVKSIGNDK
ncbi:exported hypothetical protein [Candidatus Zixiibacteriota bacterium]|nr:exported hypothetical protein [candidate division Zixibacteria bacterium]